MFAGVVLSVFAAGSIGLWASSAPDLSTSEGVGEVATTQDVDQAPAPVPAPVAPPASLLAPQSGPYTYPRNNVPLVAPNRSGATSSTTTSRPAAAPLVLPSVDTATTPRLRLSGF